MNVCPRKRADIVCWLRSMEETKVRFNKNMFCLEWFRDIDGVETVVRFISGASLMQKGLPPHMERYYEMMKRLWSGGVEKA